MSDVAEDIGDIPADEPETNTSEQKIPFSIPAFLQGLAGVAVIFIVLVLWAFLRTEKAYELHQEELASKTVIIEKPVSAQRDTTPDLAIVKSAEALLDAPIDGLFEEGTHGLLPKTRETDGLKPFDAYKKPFESIAGQPKIALIVTDIGLSQSTLQNALQFFPSEISFAISPYSRKPNNYTQLARATGHETWITLPLETDDFGVADLGPQAILRNASLEQNASHISWLLSQANGFVGVITPENHIFKDDSTDIKGVIDEIIDRGLGIVEMNQTGSIHISKTAYDKQSPYDVADLILDTSLSSRDIAQNFRALERAASQNGKAIGFIRPHPLSLQVAQRWIESLDDKSIQLAPLSAVIQ
ncbi:MAG: divergent polysaccharide deacetylase family protein [Pseudomonadota bacterium]